MKKIVTLVFALCVSGYAFSGGSQVNLQGQKQQAMGHVATAFTMGAENLFFNPGSISLLDNDTNISFGINGIASGVLYQPTGSVDGYRTKENLSTPFNIYATHKLNEKWSAGIGVYIPFGSTVEWEDEWKGRYTLQKVELATFNIQPTLAYKVSDKLGVGLGAIIGLGSVVLEKDIPVTAASGDRSYVNLEGNDVAYGFNFGVYYEVNEKLSLGLDYRSQMTYSVEGGDANFYVPNSIDDKFPAKNKFDASLPLPSTTSFGFAYKANEKLSFGADLNIVGWGVYDRLEIDFKKNTESLEDVDDKKDYSNVFIARVGAQYRACEKWTYRLGAYFDQTPTSDEYWGAETPDMNKIGLTTGFSYQIKERLSLDMSYILLLGGERDIKNKQSGLDGKAKAIGHIPGIGLSYQF